VHDAGLNLGISKDRCNGFREAFESVNDRNENSNWIGFQSTN